MASVFGEIQQKRKGNVKGKVRQAVGEHKEKNNHTEYTVTIEKEKREKKGGKKGRLVILSGKNMGKKMGVWGREKMREQETKASVENEEAEKVGRFGRSEEESCLEGKQKGGR